MAYLIGLDPGGAGRFGWCVIRDGPVLPVQVVDFGLADCAEGVLEAACDGCQEPVVGAGIDAPLFWVANGDRVVDRLLRRRITDCGAPNATVQAANSLRGACLVQGMIAGVFLRRRFPGIPLTESHPKALLWLLSYASLQRPPASISLLDIREFNVQDELHPTDHVRDAALACLSAWAMIHQKAGWRDVAADEPEERLSVIGSPLSYWIPG